jgi:hypothetical protein
MKLKEMYIHLVGFFKCTIDNRKFLCAGLENTIENDNGELVADLYIMDIMNEEMTAITKRELVIFNQVKDKIIFLYGKEKYELISLTDDLIKVRKDGVDYFVERIKVSL